MKTQLVSICVTFLLITLLNRVYADFGFAGNVTLVENGNDFSYRNLYAGGWNFDFWSGAFFGLVAVTTTSETVTLDSVWGVAYVGTDTNYPTAALAYFDANVQLSAANWAQFNITGAEGFIASALLFLTEVDSSGNNVTVYDLKQFVWTTEGSGRSGSLYWVQFKGQLVFSNWFIQLTYFASQVVGLVGYDSNVNVIVTPKTFESVVEITDYPYANPSNALRLTLGAATGSAAISGSGSVNIGSGLSEVYFSLSGSATISGTTKSVSVSEWTNLDISVLGNADLQAQLNLQFGGSIMLGVSSVTFPPNAASIIYDPTIGSGPPATTSSVSSLSPAMGIVSLVVLLKLLFF